MLMQTDLKTPNVFISQVERVVEFGNSTMVTPYATVVTYYKALLETFDDAPSTDPWKTVETTTASAQAFFYYQSNEIQLILEGLPAGFNAAVGPTTGDELQGAN